MKNIILYGFSLVLLFACKGHEEVFEQGQTYNSFRGFEPVDPIEYNDLIILTDNGRLYEKEIKLLTNDEILQFLTNETVLVSIGQVNAEGGISYIPVTVSAKHTSYKVTMDYMKFATLPQVRENGSFIGFNRVGVGLRLITLMTTSEAGINIGDLSSIGLAAREGKIKGTLMIEVVGIKSKEITTLLPLPSEINQTTIQNAMQALATIKSKIYDEDTRLYPQVMAIKPDSTSTKRRIVVEDPTSPNPPLLGSNPDPENPVQPVLDNDIQLQIGHSKPSSSLSKFQLASRAELQAFEYLFQKDIEKAISSFEECEKIYPGFHSVYDITRELKSRKASLTDPSSPLWKETYSLILSKYSWKLPQEVMDQLKEKSL